MNRDIILQWEKNKTATTWDDLTELQTWTIAQRADLAHFLDNAQTVWGFRIRYKMAGLLPLGLTEDTLRNRTIDLSKTGYTITQLLTANMDAPPHAPLNALRQLTQIIKVNGVLMLPNQMYLTKRQLCQAQQL